MFYAQSASTVVSGRRERERQTEKQTQRETETERQRERNTDRQRQTVRDTDRQTETEIGNCVAIVGT